MLDVMAADRTLATEKDRQIFELRAQIAALTEKLSALLVEKQFIQERLDLYRYPLLTLPSEITSEIFIQFLPPYPETPPLTGLLSPLSLTHICRQWRYIALATPALWRAIEMIFSRSSRQTRIGVEAANSIASLWFQRSGSLPLSIRLFDHKKITLIVSTLLQYRARWEHLEATLEASRLLGVAEGAIPLLRSLSLTFSLTKSAAPVVLEDVPLLRTVTLNHLAGPRISLPWSQLTTLTLRHIHPENCMLILRQASHLVHCTLLLWEHGIPWEEQRDIAIGTDVTVPRLETLCLTAQIDSSLSAELFCSLVTPALVRLQIAEDFLRASGLNVIQTLEAFMSRSGCQLREMEVTSASIPMKAYRDAFPAISIGL
ncbi:F-box domain-containing protein [Favolaschia claudopus]|uniref:F-box domain-containing protein n=1 Tax=Favolaschia claudopus TaxID=2862362 RepID=A0AAW0AMU9_9AGAR